MQCLDENTIVSFFEGQGSREVTAPVDEHLAACGACRRLVAEYAAAAPALRVAGSSLLALQSLEATSSVLRAPTDLATRIACADAARRISRARGRVGTVLAGKYRLDRVLGVGGMAVVYKATHRNEAELAVKMLHPELGMRHEVLTRFLREGKAANSVKHPGVVLVVDDDVAEDGAAFLVMELLHGITVESAWERAGRRLPVVAALSVADQLLDVLAAAHARGIVHRDLKPANLFITRDGSLKVLDFGIARVRDAAADGPGQGTGGGMLLGTPGFMAPEQAFGRSEAIDGQTDLWAVGATLYTLLSGEHVHAGDNPSQLMVRAATEHARPIREVCPELAPSVAQWLDRALSFDKAARWPNAAAMREALVRASVDAFGARPQKGSLAPLSAESDGAIADVDLGHARTEHSPPRAPSDGTNRGRLEGGSTLVSMGDGAVVAPARSERRRVSAVTLASIAVVVVAAAGLGLGTKLGGGLGATGGPSESPLLVPTLLPLATTAPPATALAPSATESSTRPAASADAGVLPSSARPTGAGVTRPPAPGSVPRSATSRPAQRPPSSGKPAGCDPDFTYDADGNKIFKPACFGR